MTLHYRFGKYRAQTMQIDKVERSWQNSLDLVSILLLFPRIDFERARSPSGKAEDCKSSIVGSIPTRASISF